MIIRYISCDGYPVEEKIARVDFCQNILSPYDQFIQCIRPNGDIFEIDDFTRVDWIKEER